MHELAQYPTAILKTPFGPLVITFLDPLLSVESDKLEGRNYRDSHYNNAPCYAARGTLTINGIALNISESYRIGEKYKHSSDYREEPISLGKGLITCTGHSYNRRADGRAWDWQSGYARTLSEVLPPLIETFVRAHADLETLARKVTLTNHIIRIDSKRDALLKELAANHEQFLTACKNLETFNAENA